MKWNSLFREALLGAIIALVPLSLTAQTQSVPSVPAFISPQALEVLKLAQSGVDDSVILAYVNKSPIRFSLSADDVVYLKQSGLSPAVLSAVVSRDAALRAEPQPAKSDYGQKLYAPAHPVASSQPTPAGAGPAPAPAPQIPDAPSIPDAPTVAPAPGVLPPTTTQPPTQPSVVIDQRPPPPKLEVVPLAPSPRYVWVPGYWGYRAGRWNWVSGTWVLRPYPTAAWIGGHWAAHGRGWIWISGRWR